MAFEGLDEESVLDSLGGGGAKGGYCKESDRPAAREESSCWWTPDPPPPPPPALLSWRPEYLTASGVARSGFPMENLVSTISQRFYHSKLNPPFWKIAHLPTQLVKLKEKKNLLGCLGGWLSWLSVRLQLRSGSHGSWV